VTLREGSPDAPAVTPAALDVPADAAQPARPRAGRPVVLAAGVVLLACAVLVSLALGSRSLATADVVRVLLSADASDTSAIVRELRLPRTVLGLAVGAALGIAGAQLQGLTRNALADPGLLGVSAGAALAVVATGSVLGVGGAAGQVWAALLGAVLATAAVWVLAGQGRSRGPLDLVLAGVALTALLGSLTTVLVLLDADTLDEYRFWAVGSLAGRDVALLGAVAPLLALGLLLAAVTTRTLDVLALGDDLAAGLGARVAWGRGGIALSATLLTAGAVALCGPLVFVGLVVPHAARALVGPAHRWLLPMSALLGAALLLLADTLGRIVVRPAELQVGIVTALVGAPVLVALVRRRRLAGG
jgi:iron complex transport system permease protein